MTKVFKYGLGDEVAVNTKAIKGVPNAVGKTGVIISQLTDSKYYDYEVGFDSISTGRFKEDELDMVINLDDEWVKVDNKNIVTATIPQPEESVVNIDKDLHKKILDEIHDTYIRKNADYGNSFGDQFNEYGLLSAIIRFDDKIRRVKQLNKHDAKVKDESIRDTVLDLANYAIMTVMELDKGSK
jgi:hypothetical protein